MVALEGLAPAAGFARKGLWTDPAGLDRIELCLTAGMECPGDSPQQQSEEEHVSTTKISKDRTSTKSMEDALAQLGAVDPPSHLIDPAMTGNALAVLERRYLKKDHDTSEVIETPRQLFWRVASHIATPEIEFAGGSPEKALAIASEFYNLMATKKFMPNSPTLMNAGREMGMLSACFVLPVEDSIQGIFDSIKATALIQKSGGGTGFSFSRLRPRGDIVKSSGGTTEGPLSFIQVFSKATDAIQQGAFRRGANMGMLRVDHPDIAEFITVKDNLSTLENYNISVAATDKFLEELESDPETIHEVQNPRSKEWKQLEKHDGSGEVWTVGEVWTTIVEHAWRTGEPGIIFIDRINAKNPIKNVGLIEATNPCGEQPLHPYDSCNLGSINLGLFVKESSDGELAFDWNEFKAVVHSTTRFLDDVIQINKYPLPQIDQMSKTTRRIGLGVMGFADALYKLNIPYNTEAGCEFGEEVMQVLNDESHLASELLAEERGVFPAWEGSDWEKAGRRLRNSYTTTVAPTGTISIIADCSGGIEPMFSLAFIRQVMKDIEGVPTKLEEVNYVFEKLAKDRGLYSSELIERITEEGSLAHIDELPDDMKEVFVTAHDITPYWHMRMQAAFQRHCDSSISKTINFPHDATAEDVDKIYRLAIDLDVKGVTVYRDGCRDMQPMALKGSENRVEGGAAPAGRGGPASGRGQRDRGPGPDQAARDHALAADPADDPLRQHAREGLGRPLVRPRARGLRTARQGRRRRQLGPGGDLPHALAVDAGQRKPGDGAQPAPRNRVEHDCSHQGRADHVARRWSGPRPQSLPRGEGRVRLGGSPLGQSRLR